MAAIHQVKDALNTAIGEIGAPSGPLGLERGRAGGVGAGAVAVATRSAHRRRNLHAGRRGHCGKRAVSNNVQTVATGTEEMGASIGIAKNATEAARGADGVQVAEATNNTVRQAGSLVGPR